SSVNGVPNHRLVSRRRTGGAFRSVATSDRPGAAGTTTLTPKNLSANRSRPASTSRRAEGRTVNDHGSNSGPPTTTKSQKTPKSLDHHTAGGSVGTSAKLHGSDGRKTDRYTSAKRRNSPRK